MSGWFDLVGLNVFECEIKRAGGRLSSLSSRPPAAERVRPSEEGGPGGGNGACVGLIPGVQIAGFGDGKKNLL